MREHQGVLRQDHARQSRVLILRLQRQRQGRARISQQSRVRLWFARGRNAQRSCYQLRQRATLEGVRNARRANNAKRRGAFVARACLLSAVAQRRSALRSDGSVRTAIHSRRYQNAGHRKQSHLQVRGIASGTNEEWPH